MTPSSLHYRLPMLKPQATEEHRRQPFDAIRYDSVETQLPSKYSQAPYHTLNTQFNTMFLFLFQCLADGSRSQRFMRNHKISVLF